jgi:hypothetical protein
VAATTSIFDLFCEIWRFFCSIPQNLTTKFCGVAGFSCLEPVIQTEVNTKRQRAKVHYINW